jgi:predicted dehydrogenase
MERRTFLLGASLALGARGANDRVGIGIIGIGGRGTEHIVDYSRLPDAQVVALCDVNTAQTERGAELAERLHGAKPRLYRDLRRLFEDKSVDAVSIATPNHWHSLATIWACQAGKDVYCEKPASFNIFEGRQMVAAARHTGRMVQIGMQSRSLAHKQRAVELLRQRSHRQGLYGAGHLLQAPEVDRPHAGGDGSARAQLGSVSRPGADARVYAEPVSI